MERGHTEPLDRGWFGGHRRRRPYSLNLLVALCGLTCAAWSGCKRETPTKADRPLSAEERKAIPGVIAFVSERGPDKDIWLIRPTGAETRLTDGPEDEFPAAFRPGGRELLAIAAREVDGAHREQLRMLPVPDAGANSPGVPGIAAEPVLLDAPGGRARNPSFASDGSFLVFESDAYGFSDVVRLVPRSAPERMTRMDTGSFEPSVAPDGQRIAFVSSRDGNPELYLRHADGRVQRLTESPGEDGRPSWSPDGQWLAFFTSREPRRVRAYLMRPDGTGVRPLSSDIDTGDERDLAWRPDSRAVAFVGRQKDATTQIYLVEIGAGTEPGTGPEIGPTAVLTDGRQRDDQPAWSPDGKYLAYVSDRDGEADLFLMRADGTGKTQLTRSPGADWLPRWASRDTSAAPPGWQPPEPLVAMAALYRQRAEALEPSVTPMVRQLARAIGGEPAGLEHRLKSLSSLQRKIGDRLAKDAKLALKDVVIGDALRYTIRIDDQPSGRYTESVQKTLQQLQERGHAVVQVKNYWPRGDNYSGVNTILLSPTGLRWELQFHTSQSLATRNRDHPKYRELRALDTPLARRQTLFDEMSAPWDKIPIPARVLDDKSLHEREEIIERSRP